MISQLANISRDSQFVEVGLWPLRDSGRNNGSAVLVHLAAYLGERTGVHRVGQMHVEDLGMLASQNQCMIDSQLYKRNKT